MTTLDDRPNSAVVIIDVQVDVVAAAYERDTVIAAIAILVERARHEGIAMVWEQHADADGR